MKGIPRYLAAACTFVLLNAAILHAHKAGPDPRHTGAPGDDPLTCASPTCHVGGPAINAGGGKVEVQFPNGLIYTPGLPQMLTVKVTDAAERFFGFQMTARLGSEPANTPAGSFSAGPGEIVICDNACKPNVVQFVEHSTPSNTGTWQVAWTPPSTDMGDVFIYIAANSNTQTDIPDKGHVYTAHYTLSSATSGAAKPSISAVQVAAGFNPKAPATSGTWLEIYGSNLSSVSRGWQIPDFDGSNAPTSLNKVSVTVNGKPAYVDFVSSGQVNVQVPEDSASGPVPVVLTNEAGDSNAITIQEAAIAPALLAPSAFNVGGKQYAAGLFTDGVTYVGQTNLIAGVKFRPAKAGEVIVLYGIGFGPVTPSNPAGVVTSQKNSLATPPNFRFGQTPATLVYYGLAPGFLGLYQFDITVPGGLGAGDQPLSVDVGGVSLNQTLFITTQ